MDDEADEGDEKNIAKKNGKLQSLKRSVFHICLSLSLVGYIALGAFIFLWIEGPIEEKIRREAEAERIKGIENLFRELDSLSVHTHSNFEQFQYRLDSILDSYQEDLFEIFSDPVKSTIFEFPLNDNTIEHNLLVDEHIMTNHWTFSSALLFSSTTIIPVGFGHVTPRTPLGRLLVIVYSVIGLPLALMVVETLSNLGRYFHSFLFIILGKSLTRVQSTLFLLLLIYPIGSALAISYLGFQELSLTDSIYFCISAIFTIGFGDFLPSIPLGCLLFFIIFGVVLVTLCVDVLGTEVIHQIHFAGRHIGRARKIAEKVAQRMNFAKRGLGMGLAMQMDVIARLGQQSGSIRRFPTKYRRSTLLSFKHPRETRESFAFEPHVEMDFVDDI